MISGGEKRARKIERVALVVTDNVTTLLPRRSERTIGKIINSRVKGLGPPPESRAKPRGDEDAYGI